MRWIVRFVALAIASSTVVALAACDDGYDDDYGYRGHGRHCSNPVRQCQTVCQDYCDAWGYCYPYCYDSCWNDCDDSTGSSSSSGGTTYVDASTEAVPPDAARTDAGSSSVGAPLCSPCATNDDCQEGALCIFYGVPAAADAGDAGATSASFCGSACTSTCPTGFTCATLDTHQQCVPTNGRCQ